MRTMPIIEVKSERSKKIMKSLLTFNYSKEMERVEKEGGQFSCDPVWIDGGIRTVIDWNEAGLMFDYSLYGDKGGWIFVDKARHKIVAASKPTTTYISYREFLGMKNPPVEPFKKIIFCEKSGNYYDAELW